ncbi:hypothetical protein D3C80_1605220 [compost metagenome]
MRQPSSLVSPRCSTLSFMADIWSTSFFMVSGLLKWRATSVCMPRYSKRGASSTLIWLTSLSSTPKREIRDWAPQKAPSMS